MDFLTLSAVGGTAFVASLLGSVTGSGATAALLPVLVFCLGVRECIPILTIAILSSNLGRVWFHRGKIPEKKYAMMLLFGYLFATFLIAGPVNAAENQPDVWQTSINAQSKERYIPVELWTGSEWDGERALKTPKVDGTYRHRTSTYHIKGPMEWRHPVMGQTSTVYERINPDERRGGVKSQIFTINTDRTGLGRLFDGRPGRDTRTYSGGLKFPLGLWKEGESKSFTYKVWDSRETERVETITIERIDFAYQGTVHCLEIFWTVKNGTGRKTFDRHSYIYCPRKSMVNQVQY